MFRFTKYKPSVLKTLEQTCSETHFRIKASNLSQTIFKDLSVLADRKNFFPPMQRVMKLHKAEQKLFEI